MGGCHTECLCGCVGVGQGERRKRNEVRVGREGESGGEKKDGRRKEGGKEGGMEVMIGRER